MPIIFVRLLRRIGAASAPALRTKSSNAASTTLASSKMSAWDGAPLGALGSSGSRSPKVSSNDVATTCWYASRRDAGHMPCVRSSCMTPPTLTESHPGTCPLWPRTRLSHCPMSFCVRLSPKRCQKSKSPLCVTKSSSLSRREVQPLAVGRHMVTHSPGEKRCGCDSATVGTELVANLVWPMYSVASGGLRRRRARVASHAVTWSGSSDHRKVCTSLAAKSARLDGT
mmetsp:Transcript_11289/g.39253  ORF Transcript_11289/g.39253 Transcript_11289/m.39253 type:complete len:227 (+) Transcript_11289:3845-4525(+)